MPGDGTGVSISNWILNKYDWIETDKVPGVCARQESARPQNFIGTIWSLEWNVKAFGTAYFQQFETETNLHWLLLTPILRQRQN